MFNKDKQTRRTVLGVVLGAGAMLAGMTAMPAHALDGKLSVWGGLVFSDRANQTYMDEVRAWGEENGVEIDVIMINKNEMVQKLSAAVEAGSMPDIVDLQIAQQRLLAEQGLFMNVDDVFAELGEAHGGWLDSAADATDTTDVVGHRTGIPFGIGGNMLLRRQDLMDEAGIDKVPETWAELIDASEAVSNFPVKGFGFALSNVGDGNSLIAIMQSYGGRVADDAGENAAIKSDETRAFLELMKDAWDRDVFPAGAATWDGAGDNQAYLSGQTAFVANTGSIGIAAETQDPELYAVTKYSAYPRGPEMMVAPVNPQSRAIKKDTANPEAAIALVKHLADPEFLNRHYEHATYGPVYQAQTTADVFNGDDAILAGLLDLAQNGTAPAWPDLFNTAFADTYNNYIIPKMVQRVLIDEWDIDRAMDEAQQQTQLIYDKY